MQEIQAKINADREKLKHEKNLKDAEREQIENRVKKQEKKLRKAQYVSETLFSYEHQLSLCLML
jgi:hypothetical protein